MILNLDVVDYMGKGISQSEGIRAAVMDPEVDILPVEDGVDVQPNSRTSLSLSNVVRIERLPTPYVSNCTDSWLKTDFQGYNATRYTLLVI